MKDPPGSPDESDGPTPISRCRPEHYHKIPTMLCGVVPELHPVAQKYLEETLELKKPKVSKLEQPADSPPATSQLAIVDIGAGLVGFLTQEELASAELSVESKEEPKEETSEYTSEEESGQEEETKEVKCQKKKDEILRVYAENREGKQTPYRKRCQLSEGDREVDRVHQGFEESQNEDREVDGEIGGGERGEGAAYYSSR